MNPRRTTLRPHRLSRPRRPQRPAQEVAPATRPVHITIELTVPAGEAAIVLQQLRPLTVRYGSPPPEAPPVTAKETGDAVHVFPDTRTVTYRDSEITLTRREFDLLLHLAEHPRRVFGRGQLLRSVWGTDEVGQRTVDVHVRRLRQKLGTPNPLLATVRGVGYRLHDRAELVIVR
jgi:two-component system, OmpR family, response regulator